MKPLLFCLIFLSLAGCGGGSPAPEIPEAAIASKIFKTKVIDGYISGANIWSADLSRSAITLLVMQEARSKPEYVASMQLLEAVYASQPIDTTTAIASVIATTSPTPPAPQPSPQAPPREMASTSERIRVRQRAKSAGLRSLRRDSVAPRMCARVARRSCAASAAT